MVVDGDRGERERVVIGGREKWSLSMGSDLLIKRKEGERVGGQEKWGIIGGKAGEGASESESESESEEKKGRRAAGRVAAAFLGWAGGERTRAGFGLEL